MTDEDNVKRNDGMYDVLASYRMSGVQQLVGLSASEMYANGGLAAVIVDRPSQDATARGWHVMAGDSPDDKADDEFSRLRTQELVADALRLARVEGAAGILVLTDDSPSLAEELNVDRINELRGLVAYGATRIKPEPELYDDPQQTNYGEPVRYLITPMRGASFIVHETRLLRITGMPMAKIGSAQAGPSWLGRPALDNETISAIMAVKNGMQWVMRLLERKQQAVNKMQGLGQMVASNQEAIVQKRLQLVDLGRSILNTVAVDKEDDFSILDLSLTGIAEAMRELKSHLSSCTSMPISVLFGEGATGLNNTGRADQEFYNGFCGTIQDRNVRPALDRLATMVYSQRSMSEPKEWQIEFNPLWLPSDQEVADTEAKKATRIKTLIDGLVAADGIGIMDSDELRNAAATMIPELEIKPGSAAPEPDPLLMDPLAIDPTLPVPAPKPKAGAVK